MIVFIRPKQKDYKHILICVSNHSINCSIPSISIYWSITNRSICSLFHISIHEWSYYDWYLHRRLYSNNGANSSRPFDLGFQFLFPYVRYWRISDRHCFLFFTRLVHDQLVHSLLLVYNIGIILIVSTRIAQILDGPKEEQ